MESGKTSSIFRIISLDFDDQQYSRAKVKLLGGVYIRREYSNSVLLFNYIVLLRISDVTAGTEAFI